MGKKWIFAGLPFVCFPANDTKASQNAVNTKTLRNSSAFGKSRTI